MALPIFLYLFISTLALTVSSYLYIRSRGSSDNSLLRKNWPIARILPFLANLRNFHDYLTAILAASGCNSSVQVGLTSRPFILTSDPSNVQHMFTTNHANYVKGEIFPEIFDIVSDTILTVDGEAWRQQRAKGKTMLCSQKMTSWVASCCHGKVAKGLLPFLARMASTRAPFDMQELMGRLVFDQTATLVFGVDPGCLSLLDEMPSMRVADAMDTVMEVAFFRQIVFNHLWKLMRWLNISFERKLAAAHVVLHAFVTEMVEKRNSARHHQDIDGDKVTCIDVLSYYITDPECRSDGNLLRKMLLVYMIGGRDTVGTALPWVFYSLAKNPGVVSSIRKELAPLASRKGGTTVVSTDDAGNQMVVFESEETKPLVYLQATLFESLRLYPPAPVEGKAVVNDDVLPSGHQVRRGEVILISIYAMGRMESVWGKDCHEFRPERWLSEDGTKLQYVPSCKFLAFNSGPRLCLGKDIAIMEMKTIVAAVVWNFDVEVLEGQSVKPKLSFLLQMENGLMVTVKKREECSKL
jgi:cytochrome P450